MTIAKVNAFVLRYPEPNDFNALRMTVLVRVTTKDGVEGWGEGIAMWPEACKATKVVIEEGLSALVIGEDPLDIERLWQRMAAHLWWYGEGGIGNFAMSAIDMALWDLKGKILGQPVFKLLGGKVKDRLPANASTHPNKADPEEGAQELADLIKAGYQSVKFGFGKKGHAALGKDPEHDARFVRLVREAMGPGPGIIPDLGNAVKYDVGTVLRLVRRFEEEAQISWIEEPFHPDDVEAHRQLRNQCRVLIAAGEREWTVNAYRRRIETNTVDVLGFDPGRAQGLTGFQKVAAMATAARRFVNPHAWSSAVTSAAGLHLAVTTPASLLFEFKPLENPLQHDLIDNPIDPVDGWATPPDGPGYGIVPKMAVVERYTVD
jgi:L-alanine-DL-glutamate epimerase-like enolase superfamily enzyme